MAFIPTRPTRDVIAAARRDPMEPVTGDAPQPGETPRRRTTPNAPGSATPALPALERNEPVFAEEAIDAHAAGAHDAMEALSSADTAPLDGWFEPEPEPDQADPEIAVPEPSRNQPTVELDRGAVPGQSPVPGRWGHRPGQTRMSAAELNVKRSRMENSPFWLNDEQRAVPGNAWPNPEASGGPAEAPGPVDERRGRPPRRKPRTPRAGAPGLFGLIALGLIAAFFSWVSAEPFWLAVGHGVAGVTTVGRCTGSGVTQRCVGSFAADDGGFSAGTVTLLGVSRTGSDPGAVAPARMVNPTSKQAYVGSTGTLVHLRWLLGFLLVLLCGLGIAGLTGTRQLETVRARRSALLMSLAGPMLLLAGFLFGTY